MDFTIIGIIGIGLVQVWTVHKLTQLWIHTSLRNKHDEKTYRILLKITENHNIAIEKLGDIISNKNTETTNH